MANASSIMPLKFQGLVPVGNTYAFLEFHKGNAVQKLLHMVKYEGRSQLGYQLGWWFASELRQRGGFWQERIPFELVIPVPLHYSKLRLRGFNQSDHIARGMAEYFDIALLPYLYRSLPSSSQTGLGRWQRFENTLGQFGLKQGQEVQLMDRSVLLVDDVITTGATLTACARVLIEQGASVSIAALALTQTA